MERFAARVMVFIGRMGYTGKRVNGCINFYSLLLSSSSTSTTVRRNALFKGFFLKYHHESFILKLL